MAYELIYYPKCSTCVKGLALLNENGIEPKLITYMSDGLSKDEIAQIANKVGGVHLILREKTAKEKNISLDQNDIKMMRP